MVPIGLSDYDNKYEEYVVIDGIIEPVGNWSVNLDDYVKKDELLFTAINNDEFQVINGTLTLSKIPQSKITGLTETIGTLNGSLNSLNEKVTILETNVGSLSSLNERVSTLETNVGTLNTQTQTLTGSLSAVETRVLTLENTIKSLNETYVSLADFNKVVGNMDELLANDFSIQKQINDLRAQMIWQELT